MRPRFRSLSRRLTNRIMTVVLVIEVKLLTKMFERNSPTGVALFLHEYQKTIKYVSKNRNNCC
jgi:hypothetical protein